MPWEKPSALGTSRDRLQPSKGREGLGPEQELCI